MSQKAVKGRELQSLGEEYHECIEELGGNEQEQKEILRKLAGKDPAERTEYIRDCWEYSYPPEEGKRMDQIRAATPSEAKEYIHQLERAQFWLWDFVMDKELWYEAEKYVTDHADEDIPFLW